MKKHLTTVAVLACTFVLTPAMAMDDATPESIEKECRAYAKEDGVLAEEMASYMRECIEDLSSPQNEESTEKGPDKE